MNKTKGFTYLETLIALAVLCIALLPVYPALAAAARNDAYARSRYRAQLYAHELVEAVRQALREGASMEAAEEAARIRAAELNEPGFTYGCWIWPCDPSAGAGTGFFSPGAPAYGAAFINDRPGFYQGTDTRFIAAAVWDENGLLAGRAAGAVP